MNEFRGYVNGKLEYTFPLHWVDNIKYTPEGMLVTYDNEMKYDLEDQKSVFEEILVDYINVK